MKVLVVEDEHKIANSIKKGLELESFVVDLAYDGQTALDLASQEDYDVIVLDLMIPKINGLDVCQKLRKEYKIHTPILILTAKSQLDDKVTGLNSGADDYLVKPFAFTELTARIKALTRRPKEILNTTLKIADLTLNTNSYQIKRSSKQITLSKKEFDLLEYLIRHQGKIFNKDHLINHVWDYNANILPNTVEVYIGYLRKKIDKPFPTKPPLIHTIRGFGYKIDLNKNV